MESLTLIYKGLIDVQHPPQAASLNASRFERGYIEVYQRRGRGPGWDDTEPFGIYGGTYGSDEQSSEASVDAALTAFLERNRDALAVAVESDLRARLPQDCRVTVELSFWRGSVALAATIVLLLTGKHYATREALNYARVVVGPSLSRVLRYAIGKVAATGTTIAVNLSLDPASVAQIEQMHAALGRRIDRFDRRTEALTKHVFYKGIAILLAGLFAMGIALVIGAPFLARWFDILVPR
jgi:hypothetical protein